MSDAAPVPEVLPPAPTAGASAIEAGRRLFARPVTFVRGVARIDQLPGDTLPEACFAGRSNVGKSSLINALLGRKGVARTSNTPGRTQQLNFFLLAQCLMLVDLPGYGFARAPKDLVSDWNVLLRTYLRGRVPLRRVFLLIDGRHGAKRSDREMMKLLDDTAVSYRVVLTKTDKIGAGTRDRLLEETTALLAGHPAAFPHAVATSSVRGGGIPELRAELAALLPSGPPGATHRPAPSIPAAKRTVR